ncbi:PREDICTED: uncharacterized protein LOC104720575 [Camelina sativa]|uniref:Uncharacterized protein LOC104720575 n=1 Tax=Camelina sativa TaxID=90675 RepID=A0ABM0U6Q3_CAMSA|nr:PREDICTED: uncharacterized protein LOC104720575 [Camelina sativa]
MDPLCSLGEIYSRVIREEQRLASAQVHDQRKEVVGFTTQTEHSVLPSSRTEMRSGGRLDFSSIRSRSSICSHCGRSGHEKKECLQIVGFPEWWTERNGGGRGSATRCSGGRGCFTRTLIGSGEEHDGVYYLTDVATDRIHSTNVSSDQALWHQRLGHPRFLVLSSLPVFSSSFKNVGSRSCDVCFRAKQTRDVFPLSSNKSTECFSLIHCDVWGPYRVPSSYGAVYFLTIVDDFLRAVWTYLMPAKSEVRGVLTNFFAYTEKQFGKTVRMIRGDNGTEFMCL